MARPPLGPTALDLGRYLRNYLKTLNPKMENGDTITLFDWYEGAAPHDSPGFPYGVFKRQYTAEPMPISRAWEPVTYADDQKTDTITFTTGTTVYLLDHADVNSPATLDEVKATVGGVANTNIPLAQVEAASSEEDDFLDAIKLLGPTYPDTGTSFTVKYKPRRMQKRRVMITYPVYRISLHFQDLLTGARGATRDYAKEDLAHQACDWFLQKFTLDRNKRLSPNAQELNWKGAYGNSFVPIDEAERTRVMHLDVYCCRHTFVPVTDVEIIRAIDHTSDPEV